MAGYQTAIVRLFQAATGRPTAGLGLLVGREHLVTCAHVVNSALGRDKYEQAQPGESERVQVEFPLLPKTPVRFARVVTWQPPPRRGTGGVDVAGLILDEEAPVGATPGRFAVGSPETGRRLQVFGYPAIPPRHTGMWVDVELKGEVSGQLYQVQCCGDQSVKAQPGYSGSPVWDRSTGQAVGLLQTAPPADYPERDAYLLHPLTVAQAWEQQFDYLLVPGNPYCGLRPFTAENAEVFFGRDDDIAALTAFVHKRPVVVVVGPSGVGKSSLVQAGLIPALKRDRPWSIAVVRPGQDPWLRLAAGILCAREGPEAEVTLERLRDEGDRLRADGLTQVAQFLRSENRPLLMVVEQLEELLAIDGRPDQDLLDLLLPLPGQAEASARIVLTLRADFQPALQAIPGFHTRLNERLYLLSPLTSGQMRQAVERPAEARDVQFDEGLVDQILADAARGSLPVLEFTLTKLWGTQHQKTLTFMGYHQMGGVNGALNRFADEKAADLTDTAAYLLDRVLLRLVRTPVGSPDLATQQRVFQSQIPAAEWQIIRRLADARLVTVDTGPTDREPYAELAHESLITAWQRLNNLVTENAEFLNWLARVEHRAAEGDPLPEARIAEARRWLEARPDDIPKAVVAFIKSSETAAEVQLRELRDARDRAEKAKEQAEMSARRADALRLAANAEAALHSARSAMVVALALATESILTAPTMQGDLVLRHILRLHPRTITRLDHVDMVDTVVFSPDGNRIATISGRWVRVFDAATGQQVARADHEDVVSAVAFSRDGSRIVTASNSFRGGSARTYNAATGEQLSLLNYQYRVSAVALSHDGTRIAIASGGRVRVFDTASGKQLARAVHKDEVSAVTFSPDGSRIATASGVLRGSARVFSAATGKQLARANHKDDVSAVIFSPNGTRIATASGDLARVFDTATGEQLASAGHEDRVSAVTFSPDGTRIATASGGLHGLARVFDAATGEQLASVDHHDEVSAVIFSPDGTRIATASGGLHGGSARVFDAATGEQLAWADHDDRVNAVAFNPDGTRIATASGAVVSQIDSSASLFEAATAGQLAWSDHEDEMSTAVFSSGDTRIATRGNTVRSGSARVLDVDTTGGLAWWDLEGGVRAVAFSPDGIRIATASGGWVLIFNVVTGEQLVRAEHEDPVMAVAFSPDGTRFATASGSLLRVFDAATGQQLVWAEHDEGVREVAFSPDGTRIATASGGLRSGSVRVFEAVTGEQIVRADHEMSVTTVMFSPDGTRIATISGELRDPRLGTARVFDAATGKRLALLDQENRISAVVLSPDGTRLAAASGGTVGPGSVRVFDAATWEQLALFEHEHRVSTLAFSPDGTRMAIATVNLVQLFDTATGKQLVLLDQEDHVNAVAFSPDGTRIATASGSSRGRGEIGSAQVFDAATGEQLVLLDHKEAVSAVVFSPDGTRIATISRYFMARIFEVTPELLIQRAFQVMTRPLNSVERRRYSLRTDCWHAQEWVHQNERRTMLRSQIVDR